MQIRKKNESLYLHLNISSLSYHCDDLSSLINNLKVKQKIFGISESRIKKTPPLSSIDLTNYAHEQTPTESSKGGTLLHISEELNDKTRKVLQMYKAKKLESNFIEITNKKRKNLIVGFIYKYPTVNNQDFIDSYILPLLEKLSYESKQIMLMGDFNMILLNYNTYERITQFVDKLHTNSFTPYINLPTRITNQSETLIDNIFYNKINPEATAGNITTSISGHLMQFLIDPSSFTRNSKQTTKTQCCYKSFGEEQFRDDLSKIDREQVLELNENDVNTSINLFLKVINSTLNNHAPKIKPKTNATLIGKPWITHAIRKSFKTKNRLYKQFYREKDQLKKDRIFEYFKSYRNHLVTIIRMSKKDFFKKYFDDNKKDTIKVWSAIRSIVNVK